MLLWSSVGGEDAAVASGRAARAGRMMIIEENAEAFALTEALGGKLVRLAIPVSAPCSAANIMVYSLLRHYFQMSARSPWAMKLVATFLP